MRLFIESHEAMLLSATSEVYAMDIDSVASGVSFVTALLVLCASIILPLLAFKVFWRYRNSFNPDKKFMLMEFIADLRNAKAARAYMTVLLIRRIVFVILVIFLIESPREFIYIVIIGNLYQFNLLVSQLAYILTLIFIRPFENIVNNIIEMVNELFLCVIL